MKAKKQKAKRKKQTEKKRKKKVERKNWKQKNFAKEKSGSCENEKRKKKKLKNEKRKKVLDPGGPVEILKRKAFLDRHPVACLKTHNPWGKKRY